MARFIHLVAGGCGVDGACLTLDSRALRAAPGLALARVFEFLDEAPPALQRCA
jgi:hypothetical protein